MTWRAWRMARLALTPPTHRTHRSTKHRCPIQRLPEWPRPYPPARSPKFRPPKHRSQAETTGQDLSVQTPIPTTSGHRPLNMNEGEGRGYAQGLTGPSAHGPHPPTTPSPPPPVTGTQPDQLNPTDHKCGGRRPGSARISRRSVMSDDPRPSMPASLRPPPARDGYLHRPDPPSRLVLLMTPEPALSNRLSRGPISPSCTDRNALGRENPHLIRLPPQTTRMSAANGAATTRAPTTSMCRTSPKTYLRVAVQCNSDVEARGAWVQRSNRCSDEVVITRTSQEPNYRLHGADIAEVDANEVLTSHPQAPRRLIGPEDRRGLPTPPPIVPPPH